MSVARHGPGGNRRLLRSARPAIAATGGRRLAVVIAGLLLAALLLATASAAAQPAAPERPPAYDEKGRPVAPPAAEEASPDEPDPSEITLPKPLNYVAPEYPAEAREAGIEAEVILRLTIDEDGNVTAAEVHQSGGEDFDRAALAAAEQLRFSPARRANGNPFAARILYRYEFTLDDAEPEAAPGASGGTTTPELAPTQGVLRGTLLIQPVDEPLVGATVELSGPDGAVATARTDAQGAFRFDGLEAGRYTVEAIVPGYESIEQVEEVSAGQETIVTYRVLAETEGGAIDVIVEGERPPREVTRRTLEKREIERIPGTSGDALRSIESLPGVARPFGDIAGVLLVRGAAPGDSQTFIDGIFVPIIYHFGGLSSVVPTELLSKIDFYPGNFSAQYGRVLGGIVDAGLRSPRSDGYHGLAQVDLIDARLMLEGPVPLLDGWTFAAAGRRSWLDAWLGPVLEAAGAGVTQAPRYYDYQFMLERDDDEVRVRTSFYGSDDGLEVLIDTPPGSSGVSGGQGGLSTAFWRLQQQFQLALGEDNDARVVMALGRDAVDASFGQFFFLLETYSFVGRAEYSHQLAQSARLNLGLDWFGSIYDVSVRLPSFPPPGQPASSPFASRTVLQTADRGGGVQPAGYVEFELTPDSRTRIVPGLRIDYANFTDTVDVSPRLNARYRVVDEFPETAVKAGVGFFHQPAQYQQAVEPFGTAGVHSERAIHYGLGVEQDITRQIDVSLEGFYKQIDDRVVAGASASGSTTEWSNSGSGNVVGAELLAKYKPDDRFFGWIAYTLSRTVQQDSPAAPERPVPWDQTHILTILGSYKLGGGWELGARFRLVSGNLVTAAVCNFTAEDCDPTRINAVYHAPSNSYQSIAFTDVYGERLPLFHSLDVRIDKAWQFALWKLSAYLDVRNAYNHQNVEGVLQNFNYTARTYVTGIPILPSIGLRGEF